MSDKWLWTLTQYDTDGTTVLVQDFGVNAGLGWLDGGSKRIGLACDAAGAVRAFIEPYGGGARTYFGSIAVGTGLTDLHHGFDSLTYATGCTGGVDVDYFAVTAGNDGVGASTAAPGVSAAVGSVAPPITCAGASLATAGVSAATGAFAMSNSAGYSLQPAKAYTEFRLIDTEGGATPIRIVPETEFDYPQSNPAGIVRGSTFWPADPLGLRWAGTDTREFYKSGEYIKYRYIPEPPLVSTLAQVLICPDEAQPYLLWSLVLAILLGASGVPPEKLQMVLAMRQSAKQDILLLASKRAGV